VHFQSVPKVLFGEGALENLTLEMRRLECHKVLCLLSGAEKPQKLERWVQRSVLQDIPSISIISLGPEEGEEERIQKLYSLYTNQEYDGLVAAGEEAVRTAKTLRYMKGTNTARMENLGPDKLPSAPLDPLTVLTTNRGKQDEGGCTFRVKNTLFSHPLNFPNCIFISPRILEKIPVSSMLPRICAAFSRSLEVYLRSEEDPFRESYALTSMKLLLQYGDRALGVTGKNQAAAGVALASIAGEIAWSNAAPGLIYTLGMSLQKNGILPAGTYMGIILPAALKIVFEKEFAARLSSLFVKLGKDEDFGELPDKRISAEFGTEVIDRFLSTLSKRYPAVLPATLRTAGIAEPTLEGIARTLVENHPGWSDEHTLLSILKEAWQERRKYPGTQGTKKGQSKIGEELPDYFEFISKTRLYAHDGALEKLPDLCRSLSIDNPLIITDQGIVKAGIFDLIDPILQKADIPTEHRYDQVPPDSDVDTISEGASLYEAKGCDGIIAVGGGSALDTGKGVNMAVSLGIRDLARVNGADCIEGPLKPLIALPTTAGTGSELTLVAVVSDHREKRKLLFTSPFLVPDGVILDPRVTLSLPPLLTAATGMDALSHAVEAYICLGKNPLSDSFAEKGIELIRENLLPLMDDPGNREKRLSMSKAASLAGLAFSNSMVGMVHTIGHSVGSVCGVPHGHCMSILLPYGLEYNMEIREEIIGRLLLFIGGAEEYFDTPKEKRAVRTVELIRSLQTDLEKKTDGRLPATLAGLRTPGGAQAVEEKDFPLIAKTALGDASIHYNPEDLTYNTIIKVLEHAYKGIPLVFPEKRTKNGQ
jgi:alcohol dehydrogenase